MSADDDTTDANSEESRLAHAADSSSTELPPELAAVLTELGGDEGAKAAFMAITRTLEHTTGPLPPPGMIRAYEKVVPGAGERLFALAESQSQHRQSIETAVIEADISAQKRGQYIAMVVAFAFGGLALAAFYLGYEWAGGTVAATVVAGGVGVFIVGKREQASELRQRAQGGDAPS